MRIVPRGDVDYPVEFPGTFALSDAEYKVLTDRGRLPRSTAPPPHPADLRFRWERLIIQYVERATMLRPEYKALKEQLVTLTNSTAVGQADFADACRTLYSTNVVTSGDHASPSLLRPAHADVALDIIERELDRQLCDQWQAFIGDKALDLAKVRHVLQHAIDDLVEDHGGPGLRRHPDIEWFIDQAADLFAAIGGNVAANGREMGSLRGGPFVKVVDEALAIAAKRAGHEKIRATLPRIGNLGQLVLEVIEKRNANGRK